MQTPLDLFCGKLRKLVKEASQLRWNETAVFYAEKLAALSPTDEDVFTFSQTLYDNKEYRRAASVIIKHGSILRDHRYTSLVGRSLLECKAYEECLRVVGGLEDSDVPVMPTTTAETVMASLHVIRARAWEGLENLELATVWYKRALTVDPFCYEAFHSVIGRCLLSTKEERKLLESLSGQPYAAWIKLLYGCLSSRYDDGLPAKLHTLRNMVQPSSESSRTLQDSHRPNRSIGSHSDSGQASMGASCNRILVHDMIVQGAVVEQAENAENEVVQPMPAGKPLDKTLDVLVAKAEWHCCRGENTKAFEITHAIIETDPVALSVYPVYLEVCLELDKKGDLYFRSKELTRLVPETALAHYATGVYYMSTKNYPEARKAFARAQQKDKYFAPAWIGLGNAFAAQSETEQALAAYRRTQRLFPGLHLPRVYIGMENLRLNNLDVATVDFNTAFRLCPEDPLTLNQLGMASYLKGDYQDASQWFQRAIGKLTSKESSDNWEVVHVNHGHAMRKTKRFDEALMSYRKALRFRPRQASTYTAIGFVYHLKNRLQEAIEHYRRALAYDDEEMFAAEMLELASCEDLDMPETLALT